MDYLKLIQCCLIATVLKYHHVASVRAIVPCDGSEGSVVVPNQAQSWTMTLSAKKDCPIRNKALMFIPKGLNLRSNGFCRGQLILPGGLALNQLNGNSCFIYTSDRACQTNDLSKRKCRRKFWIEKKPILPFQIRLKQEFNLPSTLEIKFSLIQCNSTVEDNGMKTRPPEATISTTVIALAALVALLAIFLLMIIARQIHQKWKSEPKADTKMLTNTISPRNQECIYDVINEDRRGNARQTTDVTITNILYNV